MLEAVFDIVFEFPDEHPVIRLTAKVADMTLHSNLFFIGLNTLPFLILMHFVHLCIRVFIYAKAVSISFLILTTLQHTSVKLLSDST